MKKWTQLRVISLIFISGAAMQAYAVAPGFYLGLMGGPATNDGSPQQAQLPPTTGPNGTLIPNSGTVTAKPRSNQFGSRAFMGYKISQYAGVEGGISYFSTISYDTGKVETCSGVNSRVRNFDLVGKGEIPMASFAVYGKGGVALNYVMTSGAISGKSNQPNAVCGSSQYQTKFSPTVSVGVSYDVTQNWVLDASWNRIMVGGIISNVDLYALGFSYHFVDKYCGQFLCDD